MTKEIIHIYDLESSALHKFEDKIRQLGGRFSISEKLTKKGVGTSGLAFNASYNIHKIIDSEDQTLQVNLELIKNALVFYLRNRNFSFGIVIKNNLISHLSITKKNDLIADGKLLIFKKMIQYGYDYLIARNMILEMDKIEFNPLLFTVHLTDGKTISFEIDKFNPKGVIRFLREKLGIETQVSLEGYTLVPNF